MLNTKTKTFCTFAAALAVTLADGILDSLKAHRHPITPVTPTAEYVILRKIPSIIDKSVQNAVQSALHNTQNATGAQPSSYHIVSTATTIPLLKTALRSQATLLNKIQPNCMGYYALQHLSNLRSVIISYKTVIPLEVSNALLSRISNLREMIKSYISPDIDTTLERTHYVDALHALANEILELSDNLN